MDELANRLAEQWGFAWIEELPGGHCSRVYADESRVLKVPFRGEEMDSGWRALVRLPPSVGPQVFEVDEATGSVLMERLRPGLALSESPQDAKAVFLSIAKIARDLPGEDLLPLAQYVVPSPLAERLLGTSETRAFLHGDLHHYNILSRNDGWRMIDPKGLWGDPAYEAAAFIRNPIDSIGDVPDLRSYLHARIERLADGLEVLSARVWGWALIAVASAERDADDPWAKVETALRALSEIYEPALW
jgi:streptomycin 6-kinase